MSSKASRTSLENKLNHVAELLRDASEPLESSEGGREIMASLDDLNRLIGQDLRVFARTVGARRFNARIYFFEQVRKGNRSKWTLNGVQLAEPDFMPGGPDHLRGLMNHVIRSATDKVGRMAVWVRAMPEVDNNTFFVFITHSSGFETAMSLSEKGWAHMRIGDTQLQLTLSTMMSPRSSRLADWTALIEAQVGLADSSLRAKFAEFWEAQTRSSLSDDVWEEIVEMVFLRNEQLMFMHEIGRATAVHLIEESQQLQGALVHLVDKILSEHKEKMTQMEKGHSRALAKFRTDMERHRDAKDVVSKRLKQVDQEVQVLRSQLLQAGANGAVADSEQNFGRALDRFFT